MYLNQWILPLLILPTTQCYLPSFFLLQSEEPVLYCTLPSYHVIICRDRPESLEPVEYLWIQCAIHNFPTKTLKPTFGSLSSSFLQLFIAAMHAPYFKSCPCFQTLTVPLNITDAAPYFRWHEIMKLRNHCFIKCPRAGTRSLHCPSFLKIVLCSALYFLKKILIL